jgi:hypothetical protein
MDRGVRREAANQHAILRKVVEALERPARRVTIENEQSTIAALSTLASWEIVDEKRYQRGKNLMLPDCATKSPKESDMFDFMLDVRPLFRSVSIRYWMRYGAMMRPTALVAMKTLVVGS